MVASRPSSIARSPTRVSSVKKSSASSSPYSRPSPSFAVRKSDEIRGNYGWFQTTTRRSKSRSAVGLISEREGYARPGLLVLRAHDDCAVVGVAYAA